MSSNELYTNFVRIRTSIRADQFRLIQERRHEAAERRAKRKEDERLAQVRNDDEEKKKRIEREKIRLTASNLNALLDAIRTNDPQISRSNESDILWWDNFRGGIKLDLRWGKKLGPTDEDIRLKSLMKGSSFLSKIDVPESFVYEDYKFVSLVVAASEIGLHYGRKLDRSLSVSEFDRNNESLFPLLVEAIQNPSTRILRYFKDYGVYATKATPLYRFENGFYMDEYGRRIF